MDGILHKPFTLAKLSQCLASHARRDAGARGTPAAQTEEQEPAAQVLMRLDPSVLADLRMMAGGATEILARVIRLYRLQSGECLAHTGRGFGGR